MSHPEPLTKREREDYWRDTRVFDNREIFMARYEITLARTDQRALRLLSALASVRRLIERDTPKEIVIENIERNILAPLKDATARGDE